MGVRIEADKSWGEIPPMEVAQAVIDYYMTNTGFDEDSRKFAVRTIKEVNRHISVWLDSERWEYEKKTIKDVLRSWA